MYGLGLGLLLYKALFKISKCVPTSGKFLLDLVEMRLPGAALAEADNFAAGVDLSRLRGLAIIVNLFYIVILLLLFYFVLTYTTIANTSKRALTASSTIERAGSHWLCRECKTLKNSSPASAIALLNAACVGQHRGDHDAYVVVLGLLGLVPRRSQAGNT
jgi:hypothetical protein